MPFQIAFVTPLSSNGLYSPNVTNKLSLNIFAGYNGGLNGLEVGGFANVLKGDMKGMQAAGFLNANFGKAQGAQFAGFANISFKNYKGGIQASGFMNLVNGDSELLQASGFVNGVNGELMGMQASGFANYCSTLYGAQFAGFINTNTGSTYGAQTAGFANFTAGDLHGFQISGFINFAKKVNGGQIGIFNFADEYEKGIPIGLLSFVRNGFQQVEVGSNESLQATVSYKTGHSKFYNILSLGTAVRNDKIHWAWGYGVGTNLIISAKTNAQIELVSYHINEDQTFTDHLNSLNQIGVTFAYNVTSTLQIYAGPSFNIFVRKANDFEIQNNDQSAIIPWSIFEKTYKNNTQITLYPGFKVGIRI